MSQTRRRIIAGLAALAAGTGGAYAVSGPAAAGSSGSTTASVTAVDFDWSMPGATDHTDTIAAGDSVTFSYPAGVSIHNVDFTGGGPTACTQTAGATVGPVSPLPAAPEAPGWSGTCRFDTPGTYLFVCDNHNYMKGAIVVQGRGAGTTTTGASTTAAGTSTAPADQVPGAGTSPSGGLSWPSARPRVSVAHRQRGAVLRGTVTTRGGRARIVLTAYLVARGSRIRVGSQTKHSTGAGVTAFAVRLEAAGRRALLRGHRLAVELRVVVTPAAGRPVTSKTVAVALRDR
jgi:plastocyanin